MNYLLKINKFKKLIYDKNSTDFHIRAEDYFASLATVLNLLSQSNSLKEKEIKNILKNISQDLLYLQKNYKIIKK